MVVRGWWIAIEAKRFVLLNENNITDSGRRIRDFYDFFGFIIARKGSLRVGQFSNAESFQLN